MHDRLLQRGVLPQADTAREIAKTFGEEFTYKNKNNNLAIDPRILRAFRKITGDTVIWDRWSYHWRKRQPGDAPSRKQA